MMDFNEAVVAHKQALCAFAISLSRNDDVANDLVQETIAVAIDKQYQFKPGTNLKAWLFTILRNNFLNSMRAKNSWSQRFVPESVETDVGIPAPQYNAVLLMKVAKAVDALPPHHRRAIEYCVAELSYNEMADVEHVAVGTMKSRTNRARTALLKLLGIPDVAEVFEE